MEDKNKSERLIYKIDGISCASCALKIEERLIQLSEVNNAEINLMTNKLILKLNRYNERLEKRIKSIVKEIEPNMELAKKQFSNIKQYQYILENLNCFNCANKIEQKIRSLSGIYKVNLNLNTQKIIIEAVENPLEKIQNLVKEIEEGVKVREIEKTLSENKVIARKDFIRKNKKRILNLTFGVLVFIVAIIYSRVNMIKDIGLYRENINILLYASAYILIGRTVLRNAFNNIINGFWFDEYFLMSVATIGAIIIGEYPEAIAVMLFYMIGELLQDKAVDNSRKSIKKLMDIKPEYVNLYKDEKIKKVNPEIVEKGDIFVVKPGEKVPLDGKIIRGESTLDTAALTGETDLKRVTKDDEINSGVINKEGLLYIEVTSVYKDSTVAKILDLVERSAEKKAKTEKFITKLAKVYTPIIVLLSILVTAIPVLFFNGILSVWVYRSLIFLVISCPCALMISVPLGYFGGIGRASKNGILVKGSNYLEDLRKVKTIVFDKSGTLTEGKLSVEKIYTFKGYKENEIVKLAATVENFSNHPAARAIQEYYNDEINEKDVDEFEELAGFGIKARVDDNNIIIGNEKLMEKENVEISSKGNNDYIYISINNEHVGSIKIAEKIKKSALQLKNQLKNIKKIMITGDREEKAKIVADKLNIDVYHHSMLPSDKVAVFEKILKTEKDGKVAFVGDGINDAPVLARSDIGIGMGGLGSDAAIEASDVVIMNDNLEKISTAIETSKLTNRIIWQNIILALTVKIAVLSLGTIGLASMWSAVFADVGVALMAVFNSTRIINR